MVASPSDLTGSASGFLGGRALLAFAVLVLGLLGAFAGLAAFGAFALLFRWFGGEGGRTKRESENAGEGGGDERFHGSGCWRKSRHCKEQTHASPLRPGGRGVFHLRDRAPEEAGHREADATV